MIRFSRQITLLLLFVFSGPFLVESGLSVHNIFQLSGKSAHISNQSIKCVSGFQLSEDTTPQKDKHVTNAHRPSENSATMVTSNCQSSLQIVTESKSTFSAPDSNTEYNSYVLLLSSQLFTQKDADPPRLG